MNTASAPNRMVSRSYPVAAVAAWASAFTGVMDRWTHSINTLLDLEIIRTRHRWQRFCARARSPRQAFGMLLAALFIGFYVLSGFTILAQRDTVDPGRLQLWLSGGMICYAIYHCIKYVFSAPAGGRLAGAPSTPAFGLWIAGGPLPRSIVSLHDVTRLVPATAVKTSLLCVVLFRDVPSVPCLWLGVFSALFVLEWLRRIVSQVVDSLDRRERKTLQLVAALVASALMTQFGMQTWIRTPRGSDPAQYMASGIGVLAEFAMSPAVQAMAIPLQFASRLAVCRPFDWMVSVVTPNLMLVHCFILFAGAVASISAVLWTYVVLDRWSIERRHRNEQKQLTLLSAQPSQTHADHRAACSKQLSSPSADFQPASTLASHLTEFVCGGGVIASGVQAIAIRQWHCLKKYRFNILFSFAIPFVLSLSPLLTPSPEFEGQAMKEWIFVVGGIALSTLLLAPSALQIDFRRDLKRMWLLRSFPISPLSLCVGMLAIPVVVTSLFQWLTLIAACMISSPPLSQVLWLAATLPALALMTFATENAIFLAFPHHIHDQGIAMVIRAKVTFLWKGLVLALFPVLLYLWAMLCVGVFPSTITPLLIPVGSAIGFWILALLTLMLCVRCWKRFSPVDDVPAE